MSWLDLLTGGGGSETSTKVPVAQQGWQVSGPTRNRSRLRPYTPYGYQRIADFRATRKTPWACSAAALTWSRPPPASSRRCGGSTRCRTSATSTWSASSTVCPAARAAPSRITRTLRHRQRPRPHQASHSAGDELCPQVAVRHRGQHGGAYGDSRHGVADFLLQSMYSRKAMQRPRPMPESYNTPAAPRCRHQPLARSQAAEHQNDITQKIQQRGLSGLGEPQHPAPVGPAAGELRRRRAISCATSTACSVRAASSRASTRRTWT